MKNSLILSCCLVLSLSCVSCVSAGQVVGGFVTYAECILAGHSRLMCVTLALRDGLEIPDGEVATAFTEWSASAVSTFTAQGAVSGDVTADCSISAAATERFLENDYSTYIWPGHAGLASHAIFRANLTDCPHLAPVYRKYTNRDPDNLCYGTPQGRWCWDNIVEQRVKHEIRVPNLGEKFIPPHFEYVNVLRVACGPAYSYPGADPSCKTSTDAEAAAEGYSLIRASNLGTPAGDVWGDVLTLDNDSWVALVRDAVDLVVEGEMDPGNIVDSVGSELDAYRYELLRYLLSACEPEHGAAIGHRASGCAAMAVLSETF